MNNSSFNYERYFELTPDLVCIAGYDGYFKKINQAVVNTLGYSFEELYASPIFSFIHPEDEKVTSIHRQELIKSNSLHNFENRYITKSGKIIWLAWTSIPSDEDQTIFAIAKEITYKKRLESERNNQLAQLSNRNAEFREINYRTTHDLRSPIQNMQTLLNMIELSDIGNQKNLNLIDLLKKGSENLKEKMNFYIDAVSTNSCPIVKLERIEIEDCLKSVLDSIDNLISSSKIEITADFSSQPYLYINRNYLESIILNLTTNAIKYSKVGSIPYLKIMSKDYPDKTELIFEDKGMGFDMEKVKDKIFGLHQTFHHNENSKGVGLYLVYTHITSLGGNISVESEVDKGAKFTITFNKELR
ncbi:PAS domain-containing sensor histidine kinase [Marivirga salinae]|uniref:histidine kinase n=1 Tax=Marivirga salinarum TaxID=3059078 RepID=A0AA49JBJ2_9BACT|nr:PAS domain-containing sensor histidine kinase [Marivirga sp. BDSF4-3]WKK75999.1 PAS domain-containing sensor histidine kinase [Marivirga sp. BDSF4-3]